MLFRKINNEIEGFFRQEKKKALLITGAPLIGKRDLIRAFAKEHFPSFVEFDFLYDLNARARFAEAADTDAMLQCIRRLAGNKLRPGETLLCFHEVQTCPKLLQLIDRLAAEGSYRYILNGTLTTQELSEWPTLSSSAIRHLPMYPLDFEEFALANKVSPADLRRVREAFAARQPLDPELHEELLVLFQLYFLVGGMPSVVECYLETNSLSEAQKEQRAIIRSYSDILSRKACRTKSFLDIIFRNIPLQLSSPNRRFIMKVLNPHLKFAQYAESFRLLQQAGLVMPCFMIDQPQRPLKQYKNEQLFKLFFPDTGLLATMLRDDLQNVILHGGSANYAALYENTAAQELKAHGFDLYYFKNRAYGETDFLLEYQDRLLPVEIRAGKRGQYSDVMRRLLAGRPQEMPEGMVFCSGNVRSEGRITHYPIYMIMCLEKK